MSTTTKIIAESGWTYATKASIEVLACANCSLLFGVPEEFLARRRKDGRTFYCPNGHRNVYRETEEDRQRKRAESAERRASANADTARRYRENAERERRSAIAYKGHLTRVRNRIANGACPVPGCKRSGFERVMSHIASQHPDWLHDHPEVGTTTEESK